MPEHDQTNYCDISNMKAESRDVSLRSLVSSAFKWWFDLAFSLFKQLLLLRTIYRKIYRYLLLPWLLYSSCVSHLLYVFQETPVHPRNSSSKTPLSWRCVLGIETSVKMMSQDQGARRHKIENGDNKNRLSVDFSTLFFFSQCTSAQDYKSDHACDPNFK